MDNIIEAQNLPEGDKVYLKKDMFGWRVVEPPSKWYHYIIGSKRNAFILLFILILIVLFYLGINELIGQYKDISAYPCNYCKEFAANNMKLNISLP